ncbi:MAG: hypothetical protein NPINA01_22030 [Nitrospinaceae bacterium]|nr:MAG: hypothetical protein NPINA01_22030 [Nitrospinaceae bacterium]
MFKNRRIVILILFVAGVAVSFWLASRYPALGSKAALSGTDAFDDPLTHEAHFSVPDRAPLYTKVFYTSLNWYETNWRGMVFGLVLAAAFLTLLSYFPKKSSDRRFKNSFMGMLVGTPLGVCVNCVAPIAKSIYEAGSKMELALAVMFSSPTLNIVVLTMLFSIFPFYMAMLKLGATFLLVLLIVPVISKNQAVSKPKIVEAEESIVCAWEGGIEPWGLALSGTGGDYWKSFKYIVVRTVPLMLLAGFLGALLSHLWSFEKLIGVPVNLANLALISFMGTFLPLPIAFDIMLSQALMMSGFPAGFVMTILFTLGTFSIYSAMIVYQTFSLKLAVQLFLIVSLLGIGLGYAANFVSDYKYVKWLEQYDTIMSASSPGDNPATALKEKPVPTTPYPTVASLVQPFLKNGEVTVEFSFHNSRNLNDDKPFSKILGPEMGITYSNTLTPRIFFDPFFFGRGIASGDFNNDGWTDIAVATDNGFELYQNIDGKTFKEIRWPYQETQGKQAINVALVDLNNDGWLDVVITTFDEGNFLFLHPETGGTANKVIPLPENHGLLTNAIAFGDIDRDGFLDMVNGNYHLGVLTRKPINTSVDQLILNRSLEFEVSDLPGIPGQTQSALISDLNGDGIADLAIGNDYLVPDTFYVGTLDGGLKKITVRDNLLPITTENTMSFDTGDIDNDLVPELYLANIGFTKGIDVVSNIFGQTMREVGREFCASGESVLDLKECQDMVHLVTLLNPEKQDISERCTSLAEPHAVRDCMVTRMALLAADRNDASLCDKIADGHSMGQNLCKKYFLAQPVEMNTEDEIPQRALSNLLLKGSGKKSFDDISEPSKVTTAEWSWNARFADLDNDEWQDLYVVNGVLITQEFATNNFFHNQQGKTFNAAEKEFGLYDRDHSSSYTYIDIDNDGDLDIIGNTQYGPFKVYLNNDTQGNSVTFKLNDGKGNRHCIGCKIGIHYGSEGKRHQIREIKASGGFHSFDTPIAHFGLGDHETVSKVEIHWSTGEVTTLGQQFPANREYRIHR